MILNLTKQFKTSTKSVPDNPRKLKKFFADLPSANIGEITKQTYHLLQSLNQQTIASKQRLENMLFIDVQAQPIFEYFNKYFINRSFPLPDKSQKIVQLNLSILQEILTGYQIVIREFVNVGSLKFDKNAFTTALFQAMTCLSKIQLRCYEIYTACPENTWLQTHQLYLYAQAKDVATTAFLPDEKSTDKCSIENLYKQMLLFSLAKPATLRQCDNERIYHQLPNWAHYVSIEKNSSPTMIGQFFCMQVEQDRPPHILSIDDFKIKQSLRLLDTSRLVEVLNLQIREQGDKTDYFIGDKLPTATLYALIRSWSFAPKRRFTRCDKQSDMLVVIGMNDATKIIEQGQKKLQLEKEAKKKKEQETKNEKNNRPIDFSIEGSDLPPLNDISQPFAEVGHDESNAWDLVSRGRALAEAYEKEQKIKLEKENYWQQKESECHWKVVNTSAGGYCLLWDSPTSSKAQIGDIIAIHDKKNNNNDWHVGHICWIQLNSDERLEIGVQLIAPKVINATAKHHAKPHIEPFNCLMLPSVKNSTKSATLLLPSQAFRTDDKITVNMLNNSFSVTLGEIKGYTSSFTQFLYHNTRDGKSIIKPAKNKTANDDFEDLWSSL